MFDGLINIKTFEGSALSGNAAPPTQPCIYQGASHQGELGPSRYVVLTVHFVWMLSQLWKSLRGFMLLHRGLALKKKKKKPVVLLTVHPSQPGERNNVKDRCLLVRPAPAHALQRYVFVGYLC